MGKKRERVLVFEENYLTGINGLPGVTTKLCADAFFEELLEYAKFRLREGVENDPTLKQIIPYVVILNKQDEVFIYRRTPKGGESRLHNLWSIGVGGHINPGDERDGRQKIIEAGAWRELTEELVFSPKIPPHEKELERLGYVYLEGTPVNKVHFGVVLKLEYDGDLATNSDDVAECGWVKRNQLVAMEHQLEEWSLAVAKGILHEDRRSSGNS